MIGEIKLSIIDGEENQNDGQIENFYIDENEYYHSKILRDYVSQKYDEYELKDTNLNNANSMALFLRERGNIVFFNNTTYINKLPSRHGRTGILVFPDILSENQKNSLQKFKEDIKDFDEISIWYNFTGKTTCSNKISESKDEINNTIDEVVESYGSKKVR